jgi:hypothetical protein
MKDFIMFLIFIYCKNWVTLIKFGSVLGDWGNFDGVMDRECCMLVFKIDKGGDVEDLFVKN